MVVAQLVVRSLPTPEGPGSNPTITNVQNIFPIVIIRKTKMNEKEATFPAVVRRRTVRRRTVLAPIYYEKETSTVKDGKVRLNFVPVI